MAAATSDAAPESVESQRQEWDRKQEELRERLVVKDDVPWSVEDGPQPLRFVAGVDISFVKGSPVDACACAVLYDVARGEVRAAEWGAGRAEARMALTVVASSGTPCATW